MTTPIPATTSQAADTPASGSAPPPEPARLQAT